MRLDFGAGPQLRRAPGRRLDRQGCAAHRKIGVDQRTVGKSRDKLLGVVPPGFHGNAGDAAQGFDEQAHGIGIAVGQLFIMDDKCANQSSLRGNLILQGTRIAGITGKLHRPDGDALARVVQMRAHQQLLAAALNRSDKDIGDMLDCRGGAEALSLELRAVLARHDRHLILVELPDNLGFQPAGELTQRRIVAQYFERQHRDPQGRHLSLGRRRGLVRQHPECARRCRNNNKCRAGKPEAVARQPSRFCLAAGGAIERQNAFVIDAVLDQLGKTLR